ncbi:MAG: hypothetical protein MI807_04435 [Verrucomicrobiales bacterium]|nr:hypothetical protein [Verrucomicrobiales bacterium]
MLLREQRVEAIERAVAPINDRYVAELEKLLKTAIASGELDEAVKIRAEISKFKNDEATVPDTAETHGGASEGDFERNLLGTSWTFDDPSQGAHRTDFEENGVLRIFRRDEKGGWLELPTTRKWEVVDPKARTVKIGWFNKEQLVQVSKDLNEITGGMKNWIAREESGD